MPVKGLMPGLMEVGKIKIGIKGDTVTSKDGNEFRLPKKIDHFRIVKNERDENDDYVLDDQILEIIKKSKKGVYNKDGNLIEIPIRLLSNDIDTVFSTQYVSYVNGKLSCSGDGVKAHTRDGRETACPCKRLDGAYTGKDKCKVSGTLTCIVEGSRVGACYKFRTTSINTTKYILGSLLLIKRTTGGLLSFLPLCLAIQPKKTIIPATGQPTTIYVVMVGAQESYEKLQQIALEMGKDRMTLIENIRDVEIEARKIVSSDIDTDREEKEFAEEFFPENIEPAVQEQKPAKQKKEAKPTDEKSKDTKKATDAKTTGGKAVKSQDAKEPEKEEDSLLGQAIPASTVTEPAKITRDQLKTILNLKANILKINDQKAWGKLIKDMKFPGVEKANNMTAKQGDLFIENLKALENIPF